MALWAVHPMFCTICGKQYDWHCGYGWSESRTCGKDCHGEWQWRYTLSVMGKEYYPRKQEAEVVK